MRVDSVSARRLRYLYGAVLFQRLVPKAFACLQLNKSKQGVKRGMRAKAD